MVTGVPTASPRLFSASTICSHAASWLLPGIAMIFWPLSAATFLIAGPGAVKVGTACALATSACNWDSCAAAGIVAVDTGEADAPPAAPVFWWPQAAARTPSAARAAVVPSRLRYGLGLGLFRILITPRLFFDAKRERFGWAAWTAPVVSGPLGRLQQLEVD